MKKLFRILFDFMLKIPYLPHFGLFLVEKIPALRTLILKISGASAIIIENGQFKFYSASEYGFFDVSSEQPDDYMSTQTQEALKEIKQAYNSPQN